ncbi:Flagellar biosynthetic protein FliP precursor [Pseudobythopirellula maris]|uniref:Flagellar biosynthetic protein FliP n=1 Tax=Pseudobythopirellula maris TaxID=2527991 RepID=A0A5C5ZHN7_9BACT|nr:flagellar type III secretion system pore protein FliP [Pseudobythopirellula maris]TWT86507.1 Flagellar biosynthetic protein FliP precursor [Pseudobythopirellula maris]
MLESYAPRLSPRLAAGLFARLLVASVCLLLALPAASGQSPRIEAETTAQREAQMSNDGAALAEQALSVVTAPGVLPGIGGPSDWTSPERLSSTLQVMLLLTVISLAPAALLMTTSFVRIIVVLGMLRQALGTQQLPPSQVITSVALFVTMLLMAPVWQRSYEQGVKPYTEGQISLEEGFERAAAPMRTFMADQIMRTGNEEDVRMFLRRLPSELDPVTGELIADYDYVSPGEGERLVPLAALLPAYMLSELKTAFLIGFQIYLPFVILDIVVASVTISMGMMMLPPVLISLPFKLLLFVLVDGWRLVIEMLLESFTVYA